MEAAAKRAGLKKINWHMFRHTVATRLLQDGASISDVKEIMGHKSWATTVRYTHSSAEHQRSQMDKLDRRDSGVTVMPKKEKIAV
jgi:site-specific recombinase XerD